MKAFSFFHTSPNSKSQAIDYLFGTSGHLILMKVLLFRALHPINKYKINPMTATHMDMLIFLWVLSKFSFTVKGIKLLGIPE